MSWLTQILEQNIEFETPLSFVYWGALASISAVLKDQVYLDKYRYKLYPNIYVMFHADSGVKKSPPINMAKSLVKKVNNTHIITGRSSIQGILKDMGNSHTLPGGKVVQHSSVFICSAELTSSIVEDKAATAILTDLFDRQNNEGEWRSLLKMETFELKNPVITMLSATNEAHSIDFFTKREIHGGFLGRTFIIYEPKTTIINSLMFPPKVMPDDEKNAEYLKQIAKLKGEFQMDLPTRIFFDQWYKDFRGSTVNSIDKTGTLNRFDDAVLKVAMLISVAQQLELRITKEAIEEAICYCEKLVGNMRRATAKEGKAEWTEQKWLVMDELLKRDGHAISKQQLHRKYWTEVNTVSDWDEIMKSLEGAGFIRIEQNGPNILYTMPEKVVAQWTNYLKGKEEKL